MPLEPGWRGAATQADGRAAVFTESDHEKRTQRKMQRLFARRKKNALSQLHVAACTAC